jgi:hypothetical protein
LPGGVSAGQHISEVSNASRTLLLNTRTLEWDPVLLQFFSHMGIGSSASRLDERGVYGYLAYGPSRACHLVPLVVSLATSKARSSITSALLRVKPNAHVVPARSFCSAWLPISCIATTDCLVWYVNRDVLSMQALIALRRLHIEWVLKEDFLCLGRSQ